MTDATTSGPGLRLLQFTGGAVHPRVAGRKLTRSRNPWSRPVSRLLLDLSGRGLDLQVLNRAGHWTMPKMLDRFTDATLVWSDCFLLGDLFQNSYTEAGDAHARTIAALDAEALPRRVSGLVDTPSGLAVRDAARADPRMIAERCLFATPHEPHHWGLWLTSSMVTIDYFRRRRSRYDKLFVHLNHPNMRRMLGYMGVGDSDIIEHDVFRAHRFRSIDVPRSPAMDFHVYPEERALFRDLAMRHGEGGGGGRRIFVSRRDRSRGGYRPLVNEAELIVAMEALGFTVIEPELMPPGVQMRLFAEAEMVVGLGGGSMFNAVFCQPGTRIVSIEGTPIFMDRHANLFASLGLDYGFILGAPEPGHPASPHAPWRLDLNAALPPLRSFLLG